MMVFYGNMTEGCGFDKLKKWLDIEAFCFLNKPCPILL